MKGNLIMRLFVISGFVLMTSGLFAEENSTGTKEKPSKVIVINEADHRDSKKLIDRVKVESGADTIQGEPQDQIKAAYRTWDQACKEWKAELRSLNASRLLFMSCGAPKREVETIHSQKWFVYSSEAKYKIKVIGK